MTGWTDKIVFVRFSIKYKIKDRRQHWLSAFGKPVLSAVHGLSILGMDVCGFKHPGYFVVDAFGKLVHPHCGLFATSLTAHRDESVSGLFLADDDHIGYALDFVVANLATDLLVAVINRGTYTLLVKIFGYTLGVVVILLGDG